MLLAAVDYAVIKNMYTGNAICNSPKLLHKCLIFSILGRVYCREVGLEPTGDTYTALMCELAIKGDIAGIEKVCDNICRFVVY